MIETDYLVVGAGASGMAFVDILLDRSDASVVLIDRRAQAGGHWLDAYPFVRLHQPSATYGVASRPLGGDRIDTAGPNAGFYERATGPEICAYYAEVLEDFLRSGRVRFLGMTDYLGEDTEGHHVVSRLTGTPSVIRAATLVDATYIESQIPSRHTRPYAVDATARVIPPSGLVDIAEPAPRFTVIGGGKTGMDTCGWLLQSGVDPERIRWIRPRDPWLLDRSSVQPLDLVASSVRMQASWLAAAAQADDGSHFAHLLEDDGVFLRIDPETEPAVYRAATISAAELDQLRSIENVVKGQRVLRVAGSSIAMTGQDLEADPHEVYVDCTAAGVPRTRPRPVFDNSRITMQYVTIGIAPWSAATIGAVAAARDDVADRNRLCPPVSPTGEIADVLDVAHAGLQGVLARSAEADIATWNDNCRLNPARDMAAKAGDPAVLAALTSMAANFGPAMDNLRRQRTHRGSAVI
jgi:hypothetical protein